MRTLTYLGPRRMELQEAPEPEPAAGEVRVRVAAAAICGSDLHGFREASPRRIPPLVMGHEVAGTVDAAGPGADAGLVGARVVVMPVVSCGRCDRCREGSPNLCPDRALMGASFAGGFADACVVPLGQVKHVPDALSDPVASLVEPYANAVHVVDRAVRPGDSVLVIGAGCIGLFATRAAVLAGAARVFVSDTLPNRLALAARLDGQPVLAEGAAEEVLAETKGDGVDVVVDAVGLPATWALGVKAARFGGRLEAIGLGAVEGPLDYHGVVTKGLTVSGSYACVAEDFDRAITLLSSGEPDVDSWITTMPLAQGADAFVALVDGSNLTKVVLVP
ncbi:MAG TPA: alcohol dehydrogenase catalytic domain-containing protein [Actinomycetota bacterium]|nr:alcohol dehydrogenase catalytic domain-containing protein [Actinomycetota bacterium]